MWQSSVLILAVLTPLAWSQIPDNIMVCYTNSSLHNRELRLGYNLQTLVGIIEKIEHDKDGQYFTAERLARVLLGRFRLDGIHQIPKTSSDYTVPLALFLEEKTKWGILKNLLNIDTQENFPEDSITQEEKCALHWMLSYSTNLTKRTDDDNGSEDCTQPSRSKRAVAVGPRRTRQAGIKLNHLSSSSGISWDDDDISQCPLEMGVIQTPSGPVAAGTVLAGVAAGLNDQEVSVDEALPSQTDTLENYDPADRKRNIYNIWGVTLAGDLAQTALLYQSSQNYVGPNGFWRRTYCPHKYILKNFSNRRTAFTATEVYGGMDGLLIGLKMSDRSSSHNSVRLSQLLRMYYSEEGLSYDKSLRACDRVANFQDTKYVDQQTLTTQAENFLYAYYASEIPGVPTVQTSEMNDFVTATVTEARSDLSRFVGGSTPQSDFKRCDTDDNDEMTQQRADVTVVMDTSDLETHRIIISELAQAMDIGWNRSRMSVISGRDGASIVPFERYVNGGELACHIQTQYIQSGSLDLPVVLRSVQNYYRSFLDQEFQDVPGRTNSQILLVLMARSRVDNEDDVEDELQNLFSLIPDINVMVVASSRSAFNSIIQDLDADQFVSDNVFSMETSEYGIRSSLAPKIVAAINKIPSRLSYSRCDPNNDNDYTESRHEVEFYVTPGYTTYVSVGSEFFNASENLRIKISSEYAQVKICYSRTSMNPEEDDDHSYCDFTGGTSSGFVTFNWGQPCSSGDCDAIYLSFIVDDGSGSSSGSGSGSGTNSLQNSCYDDECPYPSSAKVTLTHENMKCGAWSIVSAPLVLFLALLVSTLAN